MQTCEFSFDLPADTTNWAFEIFADSGVSPISISRRRRRRLSHLAVSSRASAYSGLVSVVEGPWHRRIPMPYSGHP